MGILGRIDRLVRGNINELIDKMTDPAKEVELLIVEMQDGLRQAKAELISATAEAKQCEQRISELAQEVERWERRAEQAVGAGEDELARRALRQKLTLEQDQARTKRLVLEQWTRVDELKRSLKLLEAKLEDARLGKETLKHRARAAKKGGGALGAGGAFEQFEQLESRVAAMEEASELTAGRDAGDAELDAQFARLERETGGRTGAAAEALDPVDDELAELKRRVEKGE